MTTDYRLINKLRLCDTKLRSFTNDVIRVTGSVTLSVDTGHHEHRTDPLILNTFKIRWHFWHNVRCTSLCLYNHDNRHSLFKRLHYVHHKFILTDKEQRALVEDV